jgi:hypothetical protein
MRLEVPRADNAEARREGATNHIAGGGSSNNFKRPSATKYTISGEFHSRSGGGG